MTGETVLGTVLIADDNHSELEALTKILQKSGFRVFPARDGEEGIALLRTETVDLIITDLKMPKVSGEELLKTAKALRPDAEIIIITGQGTIDDAVQAIKMGAYDFIEKPIKKLVLLKVVGKALEKQALARQNVQLSRMVQELRESHALIGRSPNFLKMTETAAQAAASEATILIQGESGTGKELVAEFVKNRSPRENRPFIKINCAAIPEALLESELFGYEKGAFTGAQARKLGRFELAHTGTLFLDEVSEMNPALQAKLLRFIENGEFQRVGGTETLKANVRIVAATNVHLEDKVKEKAFREDLYYRLNVIRISIPPLRERRSDIPLLANHFLKFYCDKNAKTIQGFNGETMKWLENYSWRGNVRELENVVERAVVLCRANEISAADLPPEISSGLARSGFVTFSIGTPLSEIERVMIEEALKYANGDKESAARLLGTSSRTIYRKIQ
jgi:two-component system response regulator HydG